MSLIFKRGGILAVVAVVLAVMFTGVPVQAASSTTIPESQRCGSDINLESQRSYADYELSHPLKETAYYEVDSDWGCYGVRIGTCSQYADGLYPAWTDFVNRSDKSFYLMVQSTHRYTDERRLTGVSPEAIQPGYGMTDEMLDTSLRAGRPQGITDVTITPLTTWDWDGPHVAGMTPMKLSISLPRCGSDPMPHPPTTGGNGTTTVKTKSYATVKVVRKHQGRQAVVRVDARKASRWTTVTLKFRKTHGPVRHRTVGVSAGHRKVVRISGLKRGSKVTVVLKEKGKKQRVYHRVVR